MTFRAKSVIALIVVAAVVFSLLLVTSLKQFAGVMITDSIPDIVPRLRLGVILLFACIAFIDFRVIAENKWVGIAFMMTAIFAYESPGLIYKSLYEAALFSDSTTIYHRPVTIQTAMLIDRRGSRGYYGEIKPEGFKARVAISTGVFERWKSNVATRDNKGFGPQSVSTCSINVTVQRSSDGAERIIDHRTFTDKDVLSCP